MLIWSIIVICTSISLLLLLAPVDWIIYSFEQENMSIFGLTDNSHSMSSDDANELDDDMGGIIMLWLMIEYERSYVDRKPCRTFALTERMYSWIFGRP